jgi:ABC-2 type transport system ATP-binding protein/lipopolysaccharide transport system ATP-binding protein
MPFLRFENVSLEIPVYSSHRGAARLNLFGRNDYLPAGGSGNKPTSVSILRNITLDLRPGTRLGITGPNGAGKTSLLRIAAGVYRPTGGRVRKSGRVFSLLNLSYGLNDNATGYENIVRMGLFLGFGRDGLRDRIEEIAAFTELGEALNRPLRTYSSGMRLRLAFAAATSIAPDILLFDEIVGAGDESFREKAQARLDDIANRAQILIVATHSEAILKRLCKQVVRLERGEIVKSGPVE